MTRRGILVAGATGLVGAACVRRLAADPAWDVTAIVRRPTTQPAGVAVRVVDFADLGTSLPAGPFTAALIALGTTIRVAGSRAAFRAVDHDAVVAVARAAVARGATHVVVCSAMGADARSRLLYNRVKGEMEDTVARLEVPRVTFVRPSLLLGHRREFRLGERIGALVARVVPGPWAVAADDVAAAMVALAGDATPGRRVVGVRELRRLARAA